MATKAPVPATVDTEAIVQRIDGIVQELNELRKLLQPKSASSPEDTENIAQELYGIFGPGMGTWEEYDLDPDMDWKRFGE
jgi:hypothetical protein